MKVVFSHPTGNANVRAATSGLMSAGLLSQFNTTIASFPGGLLDRIGGIGMFSEIRRRRFDPSLKSVTTTSPWKEMGRLAASKAGLSNLVKHETGKLSIDAVYQSLDREVSTNLKKFQRKGVTGVYAYEDGAASTFEEAKRLGIKCLYDLPTGHWRAARRLLAIEKEKWPEWTATMTGLRDSQLKLERKDKELRLADKIFVASRFTANTLKDFVGAHAPVQVIPYGFPPVIGSRDYTAVAGNAKIKLLVVGTLSQQKGIANLFKAVEGLEDKITLTVVGHKASHNCPALDEALAKHTWIPSLDHPSILKAMREHDVLVFPSLFDGFGLVITEAMSQGTPVIASDRCAGPDLINHGENGWLVEAGSTEQLRNTIEEIIRKPATVAESGRAAMETARGRQWEVYKQELSAAIRQHLSI
jgi:hypothetical protein